LNIVKCIQLYFEVKFIEQLTVVSQN